MKGFKTILILCAHYLYPLYLVLVAWTFRMHERVNNYFIFVCTFYPLSGIGFPIAAWRNLPSRWSGFSTFYWGEFFCCKNFIFKGTVTRFSTLGFFHQTILIHGLKPFRIWICIRRENQNNFLQSSDFQLGNFLKFFGISMVSMRLIVSLKPRYSLPRYQIPQFQWHRRIRSHCFNEWSRGNLYDTAGSFAKTIIGFHFL
jgi:hypothetical protein